MVSLRLKQAELGTHKARPDPMTRPAFRSLAPRGTKVGTNMGTRLSRVFVPSSNKPLEDWGILPLFIV